MHGSIFIFGEGWGWGGPEELGVFTVSREFLYGDKKTCFVMSRGKGMKWAIQYNK